VLIIFSKLLVVHSDSREFKLPVSDGSSSPVCRTLCDVIVETRYATLLLLPGKPEPLFLFKYG